MVGYDPVKEVSYAHNVASPSLPHVSSSSSIHSNRSSSHAEGGADADDEGGHHRRASRSASIVSLLNPTSASNVIHRDDRPMSSGSSQHHQQQQYSRYAEGHSATAGRYGDDAQDGESSRRRMSIDGLVTAGSPDSSAWHGQQSMHVPPSGLLQDSQPRRSPSLQLSTVLNPSPSDSHLPRSRPNSAYPQATTESASTSRGPRFYHDGQSRPSSSYSEIGTTEESYRRVPQFDARSPYAGDHASSFHRSSGDYASSPIEMATEAGYMSHTRPGQYHPSAHESPMMSVQMPVQHRSSPSLPRPLRQYDQNASPVSREHNGFRVPSLPYHRSPEFRQLPLGSSAMATPHASAEYATTHPDSSSQPVSHHSYRSATPTALTPDGTTYFGSSAAGNSQGYFRMPSTPGGRDILPPPLTPGVPMTPGSGPPSRGESRVVRNSHQNETDYHHNARRSSLEQGFTSGHGSYDDGATNQIDQQRRQDSTSVIPGRQHSDEGRQYGVDALAGVSTAETDHVPLKRTLSASRYEHQPGSRQPNISEVEDLPDRNRMHIEHAQTLERPEVSRDVSDTDRRSQAGTQSLTDEELPRKKFKRAASPLEQTAVSSPTPNRVSESTDSEEAPARHAAETVETPMPQSLRRDRKTSPVPQEPDSKSEVAATSVEPSPTQSKLEQVAKALPSTASRGKTKMLDLEEVDRLASRSQKKRASIAPTQAPTQETTESDQGGTRQMPASLPSKPSSKVEPSPHSMLQTNASSQGTPYQPTKRVSQPASVRWPLSREELLRLHNVIEARGSNTLRIGWRQQQQRRDDGDARDGFQEVILANWGHQSAAVGDASSADAISANRPVDQPSTTSASAMVAQHYNRRQELGLQARNFSPILPLKNFNNWVKSVLIGSFGMRGGRAMDMGGGKGGDLQKWDKLGVRELVLADIAATSVEQAESRYKERRFRWKASFFALDCFGESLADKLPSHVLSPPFDTVSLQFCMHYGWSSLERARLVLENVSRYLAPGGVFIGTIPNADELYRRLDALPPGELEFGNGKYHVRFEQREKRKPFGDKYTFFLDDAVDEVPEYVVDWVQFEELATECGLELIFRETMDEVWERHRFMPEFEQLARRMKVSQTPRRDEGRPAEMGDDLWEATTIYLAFAFRKL